MVVQSRSNAPGWKGKIMKVQKYITVMFVILAFISGCGKKPEPLDASDFTVYNLEDHPTSENPDYQHEYETAMQQYQEFLDGKQSVAAAYGEVNLDFITIPTGEPDSRYSAEYVYFDLTGDKIPELHVKSARYYYILSCEQGELFIWKDLSPYPHYYLLNDGSFVSYRPGGGPLHDDYCYYTFDCCGEEICSIGFSRYDSNLNNVYDKGDEYFYGDDVVTKQEWESLTEDYLDSNGHIKEEILDEIEWQTIESLNSSQL